MKCVFICSSFRSDFNKFSSTFPSFLLMHEGKMFLDLLTESFCDKTSEFYLITNHKYFRHFDDWSDRNHYLFTLCDNGETNINSHFDLINDLRLLTEKINIDDNDEFIILLETSLISKNVSDFLFIHYIDHTSFMSPVDLGDLKLSCLYDCKTKKVLSGKALKNL